MKIFGHSIAAVAVLAFLTTACTMAVRDDEHPIKGGWSWKAYNAGYAILNVRNIGEDGRINGDYLFTGSGREYPFQNEPNENGRHASGEVVTRNGTMEVKITLFPVKAYYELRYDALSDRLTGDFRVPPEYGGYHFRDVEFYRAAN